MERCPPSWQAAARIHVPRTGAHDHRQRKHTWPTGLNISGSTAPSRLVRSAPRPRSSPTATSPASGATTAPAPTRRPATTPTSSSSRCSSAPTRFVAATTSSSCARPCSPATISPHPTNTRAAAREAMEKYGDQEPWFGLEQEYTLINPATGWPAGFPNNGFPAPQGPYYCGVGALKIHGRDLIEEHTSGVHRGGPRHLGHQRRGHARPVGVPDRPGRHRHRRRSPVGRPLPPVPARREPRRRGQHRSPSP